MASSVNRCRPWGGTASKASFTYDDAKRPTALAVTGAGATLTLTQAYDRARNVASEGLTFSGITGEAGTGSQSFTYDGLNRVTSSTLGTHLIRYAYDRDSNRLEVNDAGVVMSYAFDATDQLYSVASATTTTYARFDPGGFPARIGRFASN